MDQPRPRPPRPPIIATRSIEAEPPTVPPPPPAYPLRNLIGATMLTAGVISWVLTVASPPSIWVAVNYAGLGVAVVGFSMLVWAALAKLKGWRIAVVVATVIATWVVWSRVDYYERRWESESGTRYVDTHTRGGNLSHRWVLGDGWWTKGGMSDSGKPHGKWTYHSDDFTDVTFYWYGDEVTEGEWRDLSR